MSLCENGRGQVTWSLATYTRPKFDWGPFETSRNAIFTQRCPVSAGFLTTKHWAILVRCWAEVKTYTLPRSLVSVHRSRQRAGKGQIYTGNTGNCKGDKKVADHIPVDFVMFHTKKCLAYYTYTYNTKRGKIMTRETKEAMRE